MANNDNKNKYNNKKDGMDFVANFDITKGVYSNLALIHHTDNEFALDFFLQLAGRTQLVSRVILSPDHIKRLNKALEENIKKFERKETKK